MSGAAPVITVDGPVGAGKGALSRRVAEQLGFHLLDSGALYRALAFASLRHGLPPGDRGALARLARGLDLRFERGAGEEPLRVLFEGEEVGALIRSEDCGQRASRLSADPGVREVMLGRQRAFRRPPGLVADGRDMGTVVFPDAALKLYLTASAEERARRRHKQLVAKGFSVSLTHLLGEISQRDKRDRERSAAPLRPAEDAIVIDSTPHGIEAVVEVVMDAVEARNIGRGRGCRQDLQWATGERALGDEGVSSNTKRGAESPR